MRTYSITYSMLGTGNLPILAKNRLQAEEEFSNMSLNDLVLYSDFSDGIELMSIEIINS